MTLLKFALAHKSSSFKPDTVSFNTVIKGCAQEKRDRMAFEIFSLMKMHGVKPNDVTYNSMIDACVRAAKMHKAWALLKEMQESESGVHPDNFTYSTIIKGIQPDFQSQHSTMPSNMHDLDKAFVLLE